MRIRPWLLAAIVAVLAVTGLVWFLALQKRDGNVTSSSQPRVTVVRFGMLPYADHTYAIIAVKKGWFNEVGIDLRYQAIKVEEIVPKLLNESLDVVSTPPGILFPAAAENRGKFAHFVFGDLFQGYAIMAHPGEQVTTFSTALASGLAYDAAIQRTAGQLRGKVFAYPTEAAIKPFVDLVLQKGGLTRTDVKPLILDDPLTVNAMRTRQADFQVGGVPSRLILQKEGFVPILSSVDLARVATPSADSPELASILQNGWAAPMSFYRNSRETILRLASVNYRIMRFIHDHPTEAALLHMPYLSEVTGESFGPRDAEVIYRDLDPFVTFEDQRAWFSDPRNPLYYAHVNGSILRGFVEQGVFSGNAPSLEEIIFADDTYRELDVLRRQAEQILKRIRSSGSNNEDVDVRQLVRKATNALKAYNYLDARNYARDAARALGLN